MPTIRTKSNLNERWQKQRRRKYQTVTIAIPESKIYFRLIGYRPKSNKDGPEIEIYNHL